MAAKRIVTIDGPSGAGKSTISRLLAARLGYAYLDTGAMYRAVGFKIEQTGANCDDRQALGRLLDSMDLRFKAVGGETRVILDQEDVSEAIRTPAMSMMASRVSAIPVVREKLTFMQREIGGRGGVVAEGRDMGTVVFPEAAWKFFLDATPEERSRRRVLQLKEQGRPVDEKETLAQIIERDRADSSRALAPLQPAPDAVIIDSSQMTIDEVVAFMAARIARA
ncbi:MAG: (d)CMP kinase [Desulfurivibrionaceae bacterium]|nr:(d)CMP kinase [Desulfobulbales bacterium]MDT8335386.1 (d)CMP kinase [Desulfurivibrionaceae bacterium]